jgi:NAD(P)-dependent dehydrogenase (short-subunit alcohol dehydrogenase family)
VAFLQEQARVLVTYRKEEEFIALRMAAGAAESLLKGYRVNVTDEAAVQELIEKVLAGYGQVDVMVNTAGAYAGGVKLWHAETKVFDDMMDVNLRSGLLLARAVLPAMLKRGRGSIVNVASKAAIDHAGGTAAYAASKAAALAMIDSLAEDLKGTGVRANSVLPSIIDTEANRKAMPGADFKLWPKPEDIARVILFLSSDDAKVIHGAAIPVFGNA